VTPAPLAFGALLIGVITIAGAGVAVAGYTVYVRVRGPRFVDCYSALVAAEGEAMALARVRRVIDEWPNYTYRKVGSTRLEIIRGSVVPDDYAELSLPEISSGLLDVLVVTAEPVATGTEVQLAGRAEPEVINEIRLALAKAPAPKLQQPP
jgi:hypothetical protein